MDFSNLDDIQLVHLKHDIARLLPGNANISNPYFLGDATRKVETSNAIIVNDQRLTDFLATLFKEVHNELCGRFIKKI